MRFPIVSFNAGELSPQIDARSDVDKYSSGCRILENMIPRIYGGAERRPGTKFIVVSPGVANLLEFEYSNTVAYVIEASNTLFRFLTNGGLLVDANNDPVTVATPYIVSDLFELQIKQVNDVMWIVHPDYAPRKLTRTSATTFSLDVITFTTGPFLPRNDIENEDDVTMASSVTTGSGTLTASAATFEAAHVGALFKLTHPRVNVITKGDLSATGILGAAIDVEGPFTWNTRGTWTATVRLERNENSFGWEVFRSVPGSNDRNVQETPVEGEPVDNVQYRINVAEYTSGTVSSDLTIDTPTQDGIVRVDSFTSSTEVNITVLKTLAATDATKRWYEGAWSGVNGYPASVTFFEERSVYAATAQQPQTVWFSSTGDFENFKTDIQTVASSSFSLTASSDKRNAIRWISGLEALIFGTVGGEWLIRSSSLGQPLSPNPPNFSMKQQTAKGVAPMQPLQVGAALLFADFVRRKVREIAWSEDQAKYVAPDLSALAEHITASGIVSMAYQRNPDSILWMTLTDGTLLSMTYERDQDVIAWAKHPMLQGSGQGTAEVPATPAVPPTYSLSIISENGIVWYLPIGDKRMLLTLDNGGVAVNVGGGIVSVPAAGHPFVEGDVVQISNSIANYTGTFMLTVGTDESNLVFAATFTATTFDGSELVIKKISPVGAGFGNMVKDSSGNLYIGTIWSVANATYITKIETDGTLVYDFFDGNGTWPLGGKTTSNTRGLELTADERYLYINIDNDGITKRQYLQKYDLATGEQLWSIEAGTAGGYQIAVDANDDIYVAGVSSIGGQTGTRKFSKEDGALITDYGDTAKSVESCVVDDDQGILLVGSSSLFTVLTLDALHSDSITFGAIVGTGDFVIHDGFIYLLERAATRRLHKLKWDGANLITILSVNGPTDAVGLYVDLYGDIVVVNQNWVVGVSDVIHYYDVNLNFLTKIDGFSTALLRSWQPSAGGNIFGGRVFFNGDLGTPASAGSPATSNAGTSAIANSVAVIPGESEDEVWISVTREINGATVQLVEQFQPRDWGGDDEDAWFVDSGLKYEGSAVTTLTNLGHLEGEEVAVYGNGAILARQTVVNAEIPLAESVTKAIVGLPFRYKLKPMRFDVNIAGGNTKGSIKKITELVLSFLKAGNVEYGTDVDDLRNIDWRTTEDYGDPPALFTGDVVVTFDGGFDVEDSVLITGDDPLPCTLRAMVLRSKVTGR